MKEIWLPVVGYEGLYEVSNQGWVRSLDRPHRVRGGGIAIRKGVILKQSPRGGHGKGTHLGVSLLKDGERKSFYVHHLVLNAFEGLCPDGMQACHKNDNGFDNRLSNLRWDTPNENMRDRVRLGTHHYAKRDTCKYGHPFDGWSGKQRVCLTCRRAHNRDMKRKAREARQTCPQGHLFDGVRYKADGTVRQRYCTRCVRDQLAQGRKSRGYAADKT